MVITYENLRVCTQYLCVSIICLFVLLLWWSDQIVVREDTYMSTEAHSNFRILSTNSPPSSAIAGGDGKSKVIILMWTGYYEVDLKIVLNEMILSGRKWDDNCCFSMGRVEVTMDRNQIIKATAVVFFGYFGNLNKTDLPTERSPEQVWVLFLKESPKYSPNFRKYNSIFNWTMSYRRDSDIWSPYGESLLLEQPLTENATILMPGEISLDQWIQNKSKLFVSVMTNCKTPSKRELFLKKLRKSVANESVIDVFGGCGMPICPRTDRSCNHTHFWTDLASTYKFYLAAENSLCVDYITEKFWRSLDMGIVPVVYGGADYKAVAPPNSYLDTRDFQNLTELVGHLKMLDKEPEEYAKYFQWRRKYSVRSSDAWAGWCKLCKMSLDYHDRKYFPEAKSYDNLADWWLQSPVIEKQSENITNPDNKRAACVNAAF